MGGKKIGPDDPISDQIGEIIGGGGDDGEMNEVVKRWWS